MTTLYRRLVVRHELVGDVDPAVVLDSPQAVVALCRELLHCPQETMVWIGVDVRKQVVAIQELFRGTVDACIVHPREVFRSALLLAPTVTGIFLVHNHPSGLSDPSPEDLECFDRVSKAGELLRVPVVDCLIIAEDGVWSQRTGQVAATETRTPCLVTS